ncbi:hypothetical protein INT43_008633 [Umbelopsis isabellina]|uniref:Uncharacterized protein n=1 Tax=Mortierella isabellina TaxID=91625 RepID=A0A8H7PXP8_MORIS|nr:hypothetical protein INT43_008633 [Umbelopsis isabellina]
MAAEPEASTSNSVNVTEEEDEIVQEIPVYLSTKLAQNLYLFQYPLRQLPFKPETGPCAARIKPKSNMLEVDIPLDTRAPTYDKARGDDLAAAVSGEKFKTVFDQDDNDYSGRPQTRALLDKQTLGSTLIPSKTKYLVGVLRDKELHVTPLTNTVQLRPTLSYIDKSDEKEKASMKRAQQEEVKEEPKAPVSKPQTVQMSVINAENENAPRKNMYSLSVRNADDESWVKLEYFDETTIAADAMYGDLFSSSKEPLIPTSTNESYADSISPMLFDISS